MCGDLLRVEPGWRPLATDLARPLTDTMLWLRPVSVLVAQGAPLALWGGGVQALQWISGIQAFQQYGPNPASLLLGGGEQQPWQVRSRDGGKRSLWA